MIAPAAAPADRSPTGAWTPPPGRVIFVLNGPNLNLLGTRQPDVYGHDTLDEIRARCESLADRHGFRVEFRQTNHEGVLVDSIQEAREVASAIVINPAGLSFSSIPVLNALEMFEGPKVEVHLSNIHRRESHYHRSLVSLTATGVICGLGAHGYELAIGHIAHRLGGQDG